MDNKQYNALFSFIWNIANDVLVHAFEKGDYKKIILTIAQEEIERIAKEEGKRVRTSIFGQELQPDTYATCKADRRRILQLLMDFKETPESKIFPNEEFGYWQVPVLRPKRDKDGNIVLKKGKPVMTCNKKESEQIPLLYPGGIEAFYEKEVKPYDSEAQFDEPIVGYELSFTKYFYKPVQLRTLDAIMEDIRAIERDTDGLLDEIMK